MSLTVTLEITGWYSDTNAVRLSDNCTLAQLKNRFLSRAMMHGIADSADLMQPSQLVPHIFIQGGRDDATLEALSGKTIRIRKTSFMISENTVHIFLGTDDVAGDTYFVLLNKRGIKRHEATVRIAVRDLAREFNFTHPRARPRRPEYGHVVIARRAAVESNANQTSNGRASRAESRTEARPSDEKRDTESADVLDRVFAEFMARNAPNRQMREMANDGFPEYGEILYPPRYHNPAVAPVAPPAPPAPLAPDTITPDSVSSGDAAERFVCKVCYEKNWNTIIDCGHMCMCMACAMRVAKCPFCATGITRRQPMLVP